LDSSTFDLVAYRCAASAEHELEDIAQNRCLTFVDRLVDEAEVTDVQGYLSGKDNFRYGIFPEYKLNRKSKPIPKWLASCRHRLQHEFNTVVMDGAEADDGLAIGQSQAPPESTIIISIDKDMKQVPGWHYQWEQTRLGVVVAEAKKFFVTPEEAMRYFYHQLIVGDHGDGIKGVVGCGKKAALPLQDMTEEKDMFDYVRSLYRNDEEMLMNAQVLWLQREPGKIWEMPFAVD
jgi:DNA polymerase-1